MPYPSRICRSCSASLHRSRYCSQCSAVFDGRADARTCSPACRQRLYRRRRRILARVKLRGLPLT